MVISAKVFGDEAFAYGVWRVQQVMKDGTSSDETGHWSTHNKKIGDTWKMTIDHTNDAAFEDVFGTVYCILAFVFLFRILFFDGLDACFLQLPHFRVLGLQRLQPPRLGPAAFAAGLSIIELVPVSIIDLDV